jgi:hypothetical protein
MENNNCDKNTSATVFWRFAKKCQKATKSHKNGVKRLYMSSTARRWQKNNSKITKSTILTITNVVFAQKLATFLPFH